MPRAKRRRGGSRSLWLDHFQYYRMILPLTNALRPPLAEAAGVVLPNARRETQMRGGRIGFQPVARAFSRRRVPQARIPAQLGEKLIEHLQPVGPADVLRVQSHVEIAATPVLGCKLAAPVAQQCIWVFEAGSLAREHQKELVVEVVVIGQRQQGAPACEVAYPIMRDVVGQSVAEIQVPRLEQQIDRVGADRADRVAVALPRQ